MGKLWKHDIRQGMDLNKNGILLMIVFFAASLAMFWVEKNTLLQWVDIKEPFTLGDALWYLHQGTDFVPSVSAQDTYRLPIVWVIQLVLLHYLVGYYPMRDWEAYGIQVLLRVKSKTQWFMSKVAWILFVNLVVTFVQLLMCAGFVMIFHGGGSISLSEIAFSLGAGNLVSIYPINRLQEMLLLVGMPLLVHIAMCLVQLTLMFIIGPFWSFICVVGYELLATCMPSAFLLANYTMCKRVGGINPFYHWNTEVVIGVAGSIMLSVVSIFVGIYVISRKEILPKGDS